MKSTLLTKLQNTSPLPLPNLEAETADDLHKARFVSVMSDGSTDTTIVDQ